MTSPAKLPWDLMPGIPAHDDPEVESLLAVFAALPREHLDNLARDLLRCALAWKRTGRADHLACLAEDTLVSVGLRRDPEVDRALREAPKHPVGPSGSVDVEEMLRERGL